MNLHKKAELLNHLFEYDGSFELTPSYLELLESNPTEVVEMAHQCLLFFDLEEELESEKQILADTEWEDSKEDMKTVGEWLTSLSLIETLL